VTRAAEVRPEPLRVPVAHVAVRQSLIGASAARREGANPSLVVVQRAVRFISDALPPAPRPEAGRDAFPPHSERDWEAAAQREWQPTAERESQPSGEREQEMTLLRDSDRSGEREPEVTLEHDSERSGEREPEVTLEHDSERSGERASVPSGERAADSGAERESDPGEERITLPRIDPPADPLELDDDELESEEDDSDEHTVELSVPPPAPPEALRRSPSSPPSAHTMRSDGTVRSPSSESIEVLEFDEAPFEQADVGRVPSPPPPPLVRLAEGDGSLAAKSPRVQDLRPTKPRTHAWWELFFDDDYLRTVRQPTAQQIARQCEFIVSRLGLKPGATVLDVGCGLGLQVAELAARGYGSVGLDLSLAMLSRASEEAQARGLRINFLHADMRELTFDGNFDAVTCLGTTLGYFDDETNRRVIERLLKALKPGGALLLDVVNRDHVIRSQPNLIWFEGEGCVCMEESEFNYFTSRLHVKRTVILENGRQVEHEYALRLYSLHELGQLMNASGFRVTEVSGREALPGVFFGQESPNLMIVAVRRSGTEAQPANTNATSE
jgi:SAM-dependent methyltransferase